MGIEYGPKSVDAKGLKLEVTRFFSGQIQEIESQSSPLLRESPLLTRDELVNSLTTNPKAAERMQVGLDVLNQLAVLDRGGDDVRSIRVLKAVDTIVRKGEGWRIKSGEGGPHYFYEIDWINAPVEKPVVISERKVDQPIYPFKTAEQRAAEIYLKTRQVQQEYKDRRKEKIEEEQRNKAKKAERKQILDVVIDDVKADVDLAIELGNLKIELGNEGKATVYYREFRDGKHVVVDRETGIFQDKSETLFSGMGIDSKYLKYINVLAQQQEGIDASYSPQQLDPTAYENVFKWAVRAGVIKIIKDPEKGIVFQLLTQGIVLSEYQDMDLERSTVVDEFKKQKLPINPHFSAFLKEYSEKI